MKRQIIYAVAIYVMAAVQIIPVMLIALGTIPSAAFSVIYSAFLLHFWFRTQRGKWFFKELFRASVILERALLPE